MFLRVLPEKMQLDLLWSKWGSNVGSTEFRDIAATQTAHVMGIQKPLRSIQRHSVSGRKLS